MTGFQWPMFICAAFISVSILSTTSIVLCDNSLSARQETGTEATDPLSSIPINTDFSIHRAYRNAEEDVADDYAFLEDSIRNYDDKSKSTLVVIDTDQENENVMQQQQEPKKLVKKSFIDKRDADDFDAGFTIIVDREELTEQDVKKDKVYQDMEESYHEIQQKFGNEIKQPVKEKHVRVIVITPKEDVVSAMEGHKEGEGGETQQQSELDIDIAKLQIVKEQMNKLNSEEKNLLSVDAKKNSTSAGANPKETITPTKAPVHDIIPSVFADDTEKDQNHHETIPKNNESNYDQSQKLNFDSNVEQDMPKNISVSKDSVDSNKKPGNNAAKQVLSLDSKSDNKLHLTKDDSKNVSSDALAPTPTTMILSPPSNPAPASHLEESYRKTAALSVAADKKSPNKNTKPPITKSPSTATDDNDLVVERPKLPVTLLPTAVNHATRLDDSTDALSNTTNIMKEQNKNTTKSSPKPPKATANLEEKHLNSKQSKNDDKSVNSESNNHKGFKLPLVKSTHQEEDTKKVVKEKPKANIQQEEMRKAVNEKSKPSLEDSAKLSKENGKSVSEEMEQTKIIKTSSSNSNERESSAGQTNTKDQKVNKITKTDPKESEQPKVINIVKAQAIIEFLNKDPLESWRYPFNTLKALDLDAGLIRSGLVYPGYIERLKGVMRKAIDGKDIILSVVGGSISAGGGLYKDHASVEGLYYKGVVDWWNQWIFPVTGSKMKLNNVAIGSIGTDYFSYCVKNHIKIDTDLVLWELSANDYNRYKMQATKGARPLERFTRIILDLPNKPALLYVNFFKGIDYKNVRDNCPNFEDQQEHTIASYYHIPTLSWRTMVCDGLVHQKPGFLLENLFSLDQYHPSLKGHAQTALLILLHLRHVMRAVLQSAIKNGGLVSRFEELYSIPDPLFIGPQHPAPFCWSLIRPDERDPVKNSLEVRVVSNSGFSVQYATNFPIRFDKVICWKSNQPMSTLKLIFTIPKTPENKDKRYEVAITSHSRWGGSAYIWLDDKNDQPIIIREGRLGDPGKRTQVDSIASDVAPGTHFLNLWAKDSGFCLASIMVDSS